MRVFNHYIFIAFLSIQYILTRAKNLTIASSLSITYLHAEFTAIRREESSGFQIFSFVDLAVEILGRTRTFFSYISLCIPARVLKYLSVLVVQLRSERTVESYSTILTRSLQ